jgi:hypothetical protein
MMISLAYIFFPFGKGRRIKKTYKNVVTVFPAEAVVTEQKMILER